MNYRTIIGGAFLAVTIAACSTAVAAPAPSSAAPPARDQYYKDGAPAISVDPTDGIKTKRETSAPAPTVGISTTGEKCRRQCP
jgi:hypothetical protein